METRKRFLMVLGILGVGLCVAFPANVFAEAGAATDSSTAAAAGDTQSKKDWKQEIYSDVQQIKEDRETNKSHVQAAMKEEKDLLDQIRAAVESGDHEKAESLREQLKATHAENIQERQQDMQNLRQERQALQADLKDARKDGALPPRGINPPGVGPGNPPGTGPGRPFPPDNGRMATFRDHREDVRDRNEDVRDRREDIRDRRENIQDAKHDGGRMDRIEDRLDRREDVRDRREDVIDRNEDVRDRREDFRDPGKDRRGRMEPGNHRRGDDGKRYFNNDQGNGRGHQQKMGQNSSLRQHANRRR